jgi:hypothetical protein
MLRSAVTLAAILAVMGTVHAADTAPKTRFWNLTGETIAKFELAPAGTTNWGPDQCKNDKDGTVDNDERLKIENVADGTYDARVTYRNGRTCLAHAIKIESGKIFSIEADQLKDCQPPPR